MCNELDCGLWSIVWACRIIERQADREAHRDRRQQSCTGAPGDAAPPLTCSVLCHQHCRGSATRYAGRIPGGSGGGAQHGRGRLQASAGRAPATAPQKMSKPTSDLSFSPKCVLISLHVLRNLPGTMHQLRLCTRKPPQPPNALVIASTGNRSRHCGKSQQSTTGSVWPQTRAATSPRPCPNHTLMIPPQWSQRDKGHVWNCRWNHSPTGCGWHGTIITLHQLL